MLKEARGMESTPHFPSSAREEDAINGTPSRYSQTKRRGGRSRKNWDIDNGNEEDLLPDEVLFRRVRLGIISQEILGKTEMEGRPPLCPILEQYYTALVQAGQRAETQLVERHYRLVFKAVYNTVRRPEPLQVDDFHDYVQEGVFGLIKAVRLYDPSYGIRFSTFAYTWIQFSMRKFLVGGAFIQQRFLQKGVRDFLSLLDEGVPFEEAMKRAGINKGLALEAFRVLKGTVSLDALVDDGDKMDYNRSSYVDNLPLREGWGSEANLNDLTDAWGDRQFLNQVIRSANLTASERSVILAILESYQEYGEVKLDEVGLLLGLPRERVRQLQRSAYAKIRRHLSQSLTQ
ncbi:MAG: sigma-70 family RNA polymerase sigma factor [Candidatus Hadarchaeales archaeon]